MVDKHIATLVIASKIAEAPSYRNIIHTMTINSDSFLIMGLTDTDLDYIRKSLISELDLWMMDNGRFSSRGGPQTITETDLELILDIKDIYNATILSSPDIMSKDFDDGEDFKMAGNAVINPFDYAESAKVIAWELMYKNEYGSQILMMNETPSVELTSIRRDELRKICAYFHKGSCCS